MPPPATWANTEYDEDEAPPPRYWRSRQGDDRDDYPPQVCDEDGDDCRPVSRYRCDEDGDDCRPIPRYRCDEDGDDCDRDEQGDAPRYLGYGSQYNAGVPSYYNGRPDLLAERQQLMARLDYAQAQFHAARANGQRKLSARWATYIKKLNHSLAALDARAAGAGVAYNFPGYMPPLPAQQYPYAVYPSAGYYSGYPNAAGYGVDPYGTSPLGGVMSSLLGPMLGSGQIP